MPKRPKLVPIVPERSFGKQRSPRPKKLRGWDWWHSIGAPRYVCAPMVDQSEKAFRILCSQHGVGLSYTPMLLASVLARDVMYRQENVVDDHEGASSVAPHHHVMAQLGGSDVASVVEAARWIENSKLSICAIDLNLGCPQSCAKRGGYGSFLKLDDAVAMVRALDEALVRLPITCKIRALNKRGELEEMDNPKPDAARTVAFARRLAEAGASLIAVHGRTRAQKGRGPADVSVIAAVASALSSSGGRDGRGIPVIANGNIRSRADADALIEATGAAAAMSAEALLANPHMFDSGHEKTVDSCAAALEYLALASLPELAPPPPVEWARAHLVAILRRALTLHPGPAAALDNASSLEELREAVQQLDAKLPRDAPERPCAPPRRRSLATEPNPALPPKAPVSAGDADAPDLAAKLAAEASLRRARGRQERHRLKRARTIASREARQLAAAAAAPAGGSGHAHANGDSEDSESEVD